MQSAFMFVSDNWIKTKDHKSAQLVAKEVPDLLRISIPTGKSISGDFTSKEFTCVLQKLKPEKALEPDLICQDLIPHASAALKCYQKFWRRATVVAISKPMKPLGEPKSQRPISLLCTPFKILERPIYTHVKPIIKQLLPRNQAGFRQL